jgi:hypothetical protein
MNRGLAVTIIAVVLIALCIAYGSGTVAPRRDDARRLFPITFSIPRVKLVRHKTRKTKVTSSLVPGDMSTYVYDTEAAYYDEYRSSLFAITTKKGGWDCMRHYEILACGCVPYFPGLEACPANTMALLPKRHMLAANALYARFRSKAISELTDREIAAYDALRAALLGYTERFLTTERVAAYMLRAANHSEARSVLFLSGCGYPDYLRCLTLHGLKVLMGARCHDYPKVAHMYDVGADNRGLYGKGFSYSGLLDPATHDDALDVAIEDRIKARHFDVVVYGSYHRGMPHYELVRGAYAPHEVILLCGEDTHKCDYARHVAAGHYVFVRELE